mgnify:CR=1 FL=1
MSLSNAQNNDLVNLSEYDTVFCDSLEALEWAYNNGLPKTAIIKSSAPSVLWRKKQNIYNVEARWTTEELEKFQNTTKKLTENVFDAVSNIPGIERELALTVSRSLHQFYRIIYKAACLKEDDFNDRRLFIYVDGKSGPAGNIMNSPWNQLLSCNPLFSMVSYLLKNDNWEESGTRGISYWKRFKVAGYESIIYRLAEKIMDKLPNWMFTKEILVSSENELNIETVSSLTLHGVKISQVPQSEPVSNINIFEASGTNIEEIYNVVFPIVQKIVKEWVVPPIVGTTMSLFKIHMKEQIKQYKLSVYRWERVVVSNTNTKRAVLVNVSSSIKGFAISYVCRKNGLPLISSQHSVTLEISKEHGRIPITFNNTASDILLSYNSKIINRYKESYFDKSKHYSVGMPLRLMRMRNLKTNNRSTPPIVYISTNLYYMGLSMSSKTDYTKAIEEKNIVSLVLSKLPHKVRYKTYPEDNRRYADIDPVLKYVKRATNIELYSKKIDMRYLISEHSIFVTAGATSTLSWPVMSGRPVVFINQKKNSPLTNEAYTSLSKGLFVFNDDEKNFHQNLRIFLSQPIDNIEKLWQEKESSREKMIREYFSEYGSGSGKRAAKIILKECLS